MDIPFIGTMDMYILNERKQFPEKNVTELFHGIVSTSPPLSLSTRAKI